MSIYFPLVSTIQPPGVPFFGWERVHNIYPQSDTCTLLFILPDKAGGVIWGNRGMAIAAAPSVHVSPQIQIFYVFPQLLHCIELFAMDVRPSASDTCYNLDTLFIV